MAKMTRITAIIAACVLAIACVAGCSSGEPANAKDVYQKFAANAQDSFHLNGHLQLTMTANNVNMDVPINFDVLASGNSSYSNIDADMLGRHTSTQIFTVEENGKIVTYSHNSSNGVNAQNGQSNWLRQENNPDDSKNMVESISGLFDNASFSKVNDGYIVIINGVDALKWAQSLSANGSATDVTALAQQYEPIMKDINIEFTFDKDCHLKHIAIPSTQTTMSVGGMESNITVTCDINIDQQGQVEKITLPEEVAKQAALSSDTDDSAQQSSQSATSASSESASSASAPSTSSESASAESAPSGSASSASPSAEGASSGAASASSDSAGKAA